MNEASGKRQSEKKTYKNKKKTYARERKKFKKIPSSFALVRHTQVSSLPPLTVKSIDNKELYEFSL